QPSALSPDSEVIVTAEKPVAGGRMLARHEGQIVFVLGAIPGERVRVRIERAEKYLVYATTVEVLEPSADRRSEGADLACGGSLYAHVAYPRQLMLKSDVVVDAFGRIAKIRLPLPVPVTGSPEHGYRMRARLHASGGRFGFFREGTHQLCDAGATGQLLQSTVDAVGRVESLLASKGVSGVTACEVSENISATERAVLIELGAPYTAPVTLDAIDGITGIAFADHQSDRIVHAAGSPYVTDQFASAGVPVTLTRHVRSFFQGNRYLLVRLVEQVLEHVSDGDVIDLYAGTGLFAVSLAATGRQGLVAVEGDHASARDLEGNASPFAGALSVEHASVERFLQRRDVRRPATIVVDPPRTGLSRDAIAGILRLKAPRLVYVSCDVATLARDAKSFNENGYRLSHIEAFDLFPNTAHVEALAVFDTSS
ncbi:MAG: TRAM domain-containing protein, partial [Vicinamibacterales bacterium]|nr:TRAM domain-containing protein [Vicinamibacterales bacterium]